MRRHCPASRTTPSWPGASSTLTRPTWACSQCGNRYGRLGDEDATLDAEPRLLDSPWDWLKDKVDDVREAIENIVDGRDRR